MNATVNGAAICNPISIFEGVKQPAKVALFRRPLVPFMFRNVGDYK